jgi:RNA polymerase sigma-70 factor (ECF subfamily)
MQDFLSALSRLPDDQREALVLIGAAGFSYEEAAEITGAAVGTVKSRVNRARVALTKSLGLESGEDFTSNTEFMGLVRMGQTGVR